MPSAAYHRTHDRARERPLRLDAPREEVLAHAAKLVEEAWRSFDRFRPEEPALDERVRGLLGAGLPGEPVSGARGARRRGADPGRVDRAAAAALLRVHRVLGTGDRRHRRPACPHLRHQPRRRRTCGDADRASSRALGERVHRLPGHDRRVHQWRDDQQRDRARGGQGALAPGCPHRGLSGRRVAVYCSAEVHYSVTRAVELLGIGSDNLRALPIDEARRLRPDALAETRRCRHRGGHHPGRRRGDGRDHAHRGDRPDRRDRRRLRRTRRLAPRGRCVRAARRRGRRRTRAVPRLERADSSRSTRTSGCTCRRHAASCWCASTGRSPGAFAHEQGYLPHQQHELHAADITLEYSRPFRALKLWLAFRAHGAPQFRDAIARNLRRGRPAATARSEARRLRGRRRAAAALDRAAPPRAGGRRRPQRPQRALGRRDPGATDGSTSPRRSSTARCGSGRAS